MKFDNDCGVICMFKMQKDIGFHGMFHNIDKKIMHHVAYITGSQTKNTSIAALTCFAVMV